MAQNCVRAKRKKEETKEGAKGVEEAAKRAKKETKKRAKEKKEKEKEKATSNVAALAMPSKEHGGYVVRREGRRRRGSSASGK
jgi:hypothetical protein